MTAATQSIRISERLVCQSVKPVRAVPDLIEDAREGLLQRPRSLPPKYFYDERGSRLFDQICDTPEYYPTRTEDALLARYAGQIIETAKPTHILELGSGASRKTRHLITACEERNRDAAYWPFDVCQPMLVDAGQTLAEEFPWLEVNALVGDYLAGLDDLPKVDGPRLWVFLGGTIGNFEADDAHRFLHELRGHMGPKDWLLMGADRVKSPDILRAAYNDASGITADFNLNVLQVLNRELGADFDLNGFYHEARYNTVQNRIEMYLISRRPQRVFIDSLDESVHFEEGEEILTEISRKFTQQSLEAMLAAAGIQVAEHFEPDNGYFSLVLARPDIHGDHRAA